VGAAVADDGESDEVGRFEQAEVEHDALDARGAGELRDDLALADAGGAFEAHWEARAVGDVEEGDELRADGGGLRGAGLLPVGVAALSLG